MHEPNKDSKKTIFFKICWNPAFNDSFWNSIPPYLTNKNVRSDNIITLKEKGLLVNEPEVAETSWIPKRQQDNMEYHK